MKVNLQKFTMCAPDELVSFTQFAFQAQLCPFPEKQDARQVGCRAEIGVGAEVFLHCNLGEGPSARSGAAIGCDTDQEPLTTCSSNGACARQSSLEPHRVPQHPNARAAGPVLRGQAARVCGEQEALQQSVFESRCWVTAAEAGEVALEVPLVPVAVVQAYAERHGRPQIQTTHHQLVQLLSSGRCMLAWVRWVRRKQGSRADWRQLEEVTAQHEP